MNSIERRRLVTAEMGLGPLWRRREAATADGGRADERRETEKVLPEAGYVAVLDADSASSSSAAHNTLLPTPGPAAAVTICPDCGFHRDRAAVRSDNGGPGLRWLFILDRLEPAPGQPELDPAGAVDRLLRNMLLSLGLRHGKDVMVAHLQCAAAASGSQASPKADPTTLCSSCLERQIEVMRPEMIVALGQKAAASLLNASDVSLASLRGRLHRYQGLPLIVTHHPAHLLQQASDKAEAWSDLCLAMEAHAKHIS